MAMGTTESMRLLSPEEIAVRAGQQVPFLCLPERSCVYSEREMRWRQLAASHPMRDFLLFMAELARAQQEVLNDFPPIELPAPSALLDAMRAGAPPVPATQWPRDAEWRRGLERLLERLLPRVAGSAARGAVQSLLAAGDEWLEQQADLLLDGELPGLDLAAAPLIAAALQMYWTHLVLATEHAHGGGRSAPFGRVADATLCPCCGSRPTSSVVRIGADSSGYRYLHCSLCSAQWHMVRIKCTNCESTKGIHYQTLQSANAEPDATVVKQSVEAETCDECGHYLKIVHMERDPYVDPVADDIATVTLDLLVSEAGFQRHGVNLMLLFGDPDAEDGGGG